MSHVTPQPRNASGSTAAGLPTWSGVAIVLAALLTGLLLSMIHHAIGAPYIILFVVSSLGVALFTEVRGLFITVACLPLSFAAVTVLTSWLNGRALSPNISGLSTTALVTAVYPLLQLFPVLFLVTLGCALIAFLRISLLRRQGAEIERKERESRRRTAEADRRNRETVSRLHSTSTARRPRQRAENQRPAQRPPRTAAPPAKEDARSPWPADRARATYRPQRPPRWDQGEEQGRHERRRTSYPPSRTPHRRDY
ncbi:hypothetical protein H7347_09200 [Corynebacterium sp. zg-331]|uniref:DUF6542 domain-containing protein n=1 Tax=unclassified Corynebacterium TaxID=2624378 RepID=UPI00128D2A92|nr:MULTISPECIES: DUF6542 domain-containing protein [unclassified Corynebacterium]MBC3186738.1 hypothetical protein [Corynebacterium sp. zg-331]MPV53220.1 hypothetical protein [Corynebacterium sp. zg331]